MKAILTEQQIIALNKSLKGAELTDGAYHEESVHDKEKYSYMAYSALLQIKEDVEHILRHMPQDKPLDGWMEAHIVTSADDIHEVASALKSKK